jgi:signal peptidase I
LKPIVVFDYPVNPEQSYIKRVIGVPGDRVVYRGKELSAYLDAERLVYRKRFSETLARTVPPASYFVMGDNRQGGVHRHGASLRSRNWISISSRWSWQRRIVY